MIYNKILPLIKQIHHKTLKRGQILYHEADKPQNIYLLESGLIGLFHLTESGKETFLRVFSKESLIGHRSYFAQEPYHASAVALSESKLIVISASECQDICQRHPEFLKEIIKSLAQNLKAAELRLSGLQDKNANTRIIESLLYLKLRYPDQVWTRKEIAEYSFSTFETVTRVMSKLDEEKLIKKVGRNYEILNQEMLLNFAKLDLNKEG